MSTARIGIGKKWHLGIVASLKCYVDIEYSAKGEVIDGILAVYKWMGGLVPACTLGVFLPRFYDTNPSSDTIKDMSLEHHPFVKTSPLRLCFLNQFAGPTSEVLPIDSLTINPNDDCVQCSPLGPDIPSLPLSRINISKDIPVSKQKNCA